MKTKILSGLLVAAALAIAPGAALARGGGGGGSHGANGFHGGGSFHGGRFDHGGFHDGFAHHDSVSDRRRFRHDNDRFFVHNSILSSPWPGYYGPSYDYNYPYNTYTASNYSDVILAVQRALAQLGYYHGPIDGIAGPQTDQAIRWFQSVDSLPVTGKVDAATLRALRIG